MMKMKNRIPTAGVIVWCAFSSTGCSSVMSHTGPEQGYYPGTRANTEILSDSHTRWPVKTLAALDYPFSAVMDTLLLPWDYYRRDHGGGLSLRARVEQNDDLAKTTTPQTATLATTPPSQ
ncbi:outer membrane lipoprotein [Tatumella ptyseos ATCC 33301]|uniref:Outer membrane lipoprotein n=3 Tax=Tatumella ptyseos TaxID=82987 RepID=A0A085JPA9_9GAMM|nr:outer membrane lipoprotein [Tatumella ptyseos ATCC 33301]SQK71612.1 Predicted periplasmic lipoprotein [Tatumella ptyseos]